MPTLPATLKDIKELFKGLSSEPSPFIHTASVSEIWMELTVGSEGAPHKQSGTVEGRNPAPPKKRWKDESSVNPNKQWFPIVSKWCRISSIHSICLCVA